MIFELFTSNENFYHAQGNGLSVAHSHTEQTHHHTHSESLRHWSITQKSLTLGYMFVYKSIMIMYFPVQIEPFSSL